MKIFRAEPMPRHHIQGVHLGFIDRLLAKREREGPDFNRRMFDEDFANIFNVVHRRDGRFFDIASNDDKLTEKLLGNVQTRYGPHSVDETVREFTEEIAQSLIWLGAAYYFLHDAPENEEIHIASFSADGVVRLFGRHLQIVPKRTDKHWDRDDDERSREVRILDGAKVMCFRMPKPTKRMLSRQNRILTVLDNHQFGVSDLTPVPTHENPDPTNHFDFGVWRDTQERALYRATRRTGWLGRKYDSSKRSSFFDCHRLIRFRRNQLMLRDDILRQLSAELSRVGKGYKADFFVKISGTDELPSVAHLNQLEGKLTREEVGFTEIIEYCYNR